MADPGISLQTALYARLSAEVSCPIFDAVPSGTAPPYLTIDSEIADNTTPVSGRQRASRMLYLSAWSNYAGQREVKKIMSEVYAALNDRPLMLADGRAFGIRVERMSTNRDADGLTYQGSVSVRIHSQQ